MEEPLFVIRKEQLETGMRGYPVGYCTTSYVDPEKGLFYCSKELATICHWEPQEVIYLLYHGREGSHEEVELFFSHLKKRAVCSDEVVKGIYQLPRVGHPMKLFSAALLLLGIHEGSGSYREDCLNIIAKLPHLTACVINHHAGWGKTSIPQFDRGYIEAFTEMVNLPRKGRELSQVFKFFNILHYDHGGGNLSTFVGKAVASGLEDLFGSLCAAMCALEGPRHGSANQQTLRFVQEVCEETRGKITATEVERVIREKLKKNEVIFGFGHAVLRVEDPRATVMYDFIEKQGWEDPLVKTSFLLRQEGPKILKENPKIANPYPNVDAISGVMLAMAGFAHPEYYTVLFALSRCVGIAIQIVYEREVARGGKGTPIIRPKYLYKECQAT